MKSYIKIVRNTWGKEPKSPFKTGWGNGYVVMPKDHPWYGVDYVIIGSYVSVHGGLTYSEHEDNGHDGWCIGFDTCHLYDNEDIWPREAVKDETLRLLEQVNELAELYTKEQVQMIVNQYEARYAHNDDED